MLRLGSDFASPLAACALPLTPFMAMGGRAESNKRDRERDVTGARDDDTERELSQPFFREALLWRQLHNENILEFIGLDEGTFEGCICMVSLWMNNGDLARYIYNHSGIDIELKIQWVS